MPQGAAIILDRPRLTSGATVHYHPVLVGGADAGDQRTAAARPAILDIVRDRDGTSGALDGSIAIFGADLPHPDALAPSAGVVFTGTGAATTFDTDGTNLTHAAQSDTVQWVLMHLSAFVIGGTVAVSGKTVTGTSTQFLNELQAGDYVRFSDGQGARIEQITSATACTIESGITVSAGATVTVATRRPALLLGALSGAGNGQFTITNPSGSVARVTIGTALPLGARMVLYKLTPTQILADGAHPFERIGIQARQVMWVKGTVASTNLSRTLVSLRANGD